ncbi:MAG: polysaccharide deacetylase family protein [Puniceicoccaceae bacterium]
MQHSDQKRVNFFLSGFQKSGTTWLHRCLRDHPEVYVPEEDEVHYFDIHHHSGTDYYQPHYDEWAGEPLIGDTTSSYMRHPEVAERIHHYNPQAKIIATVRNPVDRAFSHYWHEKKKAKIQFEFEEWHSNYDLFESWIATGFYSMHLDRFEKLFGRENMLVLVQEEMLENPKAALQSVFSFLGVDSEFECPHALRKVNVAPPSRAGQPKTEYERGMKPESRDELEKVFRDETKRLEDWLGRPIEVWKSKPQNNGQNVSSVPKSPPYHCGYLHRVLPQKPKFGSDRRNTITSDDFTARMEKLACRGSFISCSSLADQMAAGRPVFETSLAISFDDGYRDNLLHALPILEKLEIPATVFITAGYVQGTVVPYEIILGQFLQDATSIDMSSIKPGTVIQLDQSNREAVYEELRKAFKFRPHAERMQFLKQIGAGSLLDAWNPADTFLSEDEVKTLASHPLIEIGAHTTSHETLAPLDSQSLVRELRDSKIYLENLLGIPVDLLAYPYGNFNGNVQLAARACGYRAAFTTEYAANQQPGSDPILEIPRLNLGES